MADTGVAPPVLDQASAPLARTLEQPFVDVEPIERPPAPMEPPDSAASHASPAASADAPWTPPPSAGLLPSPSGPPDISIRTAAPLSRRARRAAEQAAAAAATGETRPIQLTPVDRGSAHDDVSDRPVGFAPVPDWAAPVPEHVVRISEPTMPAPAWSDPQTADTDIDADDWCELPDFARPAPELVWDPVAVATPEPSPSRPDPPEPDEVDEGFAPRLPQWRDPLPVSPAPHEWLPPAPVVPAGDGGPAAAPTGVGLFPGPAWQASVPPADTAREPVPGAQEPSPPQWEMPPLVPSGPAVGELMSPPVLSAPWLPEPTYAEASTPGQPGPQLHAPAARIEDPPAPAATWSRPAIVTEDVSSVTRTTASIPVIRPPTSVRRPDDDSATTTVIRPVRAAAPDATSIFNVPVSTAKGATGPVPSTAAAMPRPVAPKPSAREQEQPDPSATYRAGVTLTAPAGGQFGAGPGRLEGGDRIPPLPTTSATAEPVAESPHVGPLPAAAQQGGFDGGHRVHTPPARTLASAWPDDLSPDPSRPASTIVPQRNRGRSKVNKRRGKAAEPVGHVLAPVEPAWVPEEQPDVLSEAGERGRLLSVIVFWAPALILLVLAGAVVWVVR